MPIYEYQCQDCGASHDVLRAHSDNSTVTCSICKSDSTERKIGAPAIVQGNRAAKEYVKGRIEEEQYKRADLLNNYGVEKINPNGQGFDEVYQNVKDNSSQVKDQMVESKEKANAKTAKTIRERNIQNAPARAKAIKKREKRDSVKPAPTG